MSMRVPDLLLFVFADKHYIRGSVLSLIFQLTPSLLRGPIAPISRERCDFGKGFYIGTDPYQPLTLISDFEKSKYWACTRGERSKRIYRQAPAKTMKRNYMAFHTFDPDVAIDDLIEIHQQKQKQ